MNIEPYLNVQPRGYLQTATYQRPTVKPLNRGAFVQRAPAPDAGGYTGTVSVGWTGGSADYSSLPVMDVYEQQGQTGEAAVMGGAGESVRKPTGLYGRDARPVDPLDRIIQASKAKMKDLNAPCSTCENRKYQDGSDDMGVSFKAPTNIAPEAAGAMVRAHEQEHVSRAQAEAQEKDMNVQSSVIIHTSVCPECGRVYVSGGTTITQMSSKQQQAGLSDAYSKQARGLVGLLLDMTA